MLREEDGARPDDLTIITVRGDSMEPLLTEGDRLFVDTARQLPTTGELCALWDGSGLVVKRVEFVQGSEPPLLRLISANPELCALYLPRRGGPHRRQGAVGFPPPEMSRTQPNRTSPPSWLSGVLWPLRPHPGRVRIKSEDAETRQGLNHASFDGRSP